ncbi:MAG: DNA polymerase I [Treponemataceae bacterium]
MEKKTIYVIDSYGLIYRSYYAFVSRPLVNEKNENVSAIYGFFNNLLSLIQKNKVDYLVAAMDSKEKTFRHEMYPEYKATRQKTPEDLHSQIPYIEQVLKALKVPILQKDGFEADDIIATIAKRCCKEDFDCHILSCDKDLMQLVDNCTKMIKTDKTGSWITIGMEEVEKEWGVKPEKMLDMLSLVGDTADNIPGVKGIGEKTAVKLLNEYGCLDSILENAEKIPGSVGKKIREKPESAKFSRTLIRLDSDVPIEFQLEDFDFKKADFGEAAKVLLKLGIPSVAKRFETKKTNQKNKTCTKSDSNSTFTIEETEDMEEELTENSGNYIAVTEELKLNKIIDDFLNTPDKDGRFYIAFDTETDGLDIINAKLAGFSLCNTPKNSFYIPIITAESKKNGELFETKPEYITQTQAFKALARLFFNPQVTMVLHNAKFDLQILYSNGFFGDPDKNKTSFNFSCRIADTMIASWLLQSEKQSNSLEKLAQTKLHLKTISYESIVPKGKTFMDVPLETAVKYGAEDSDLTIRLWNLFKVQLEQNNLIELFETMEMPLIPVLARMELNGIHIEKSELAQYGKEIANQISLITKEIFDTVGHEFNIASPKQLAQVLFTEMSLVPTNKTKKGSTDADVLEELAKFHPLPAKILEYRKLAKLQSTYIDALPLLADENDRLHTSFLQTGTATGRLSSCNPNLQNIPVREESGRRIRQSFSASQGNVLISADYSQIELVILAHLSQDKNLCDAFNSGTDVHKATASLVFKIPAENVTSDMRRMAKVINFGVMYGMSAFRLSNTLGITRAQASDFINQYFTTYSDVQNFMKKTIEKAEKTGYVETVFARRRYIRAINSANKTEKSGAQRVAINTPIQGTAADIVKKAMLQVFSMLEEKYPDAKMLLQVHDELICECPEEIAEKVSCDIKQCMENIIKLNVPLKVCVETGKRWGEFH